ncbi:hypothetical protein JGU66_05245 [Myxococcaceae bacterium JPH2]|nr:hypothetical protein [Myxococcaceae bacterium JPH2]
MGKRWNRRARIGWMLLLLGLGCSSDLRPATPVETPPGVDPDAAHCASTRSGERIPLRQGEALATGTQESFTGLTARVDALCAECHRAPKAVGNFSFEDTRDSLSTQGHRMAERILQGAMPPGASADTQRQAVEVGRVLLAWLEQGAPQGTFEVKDAPGGGPRTEVTAYVAKGMTDLGHCIPEDSLRGADPEKDAYFATLTQLPRFLSDADSEVATLNTARLARHGTFAFAPTYALFSDNARKLRLVHVPAGQSIAYDAASRSFKVPPNTRFYKTFFKAVVGADGQTRYRRIETRLIVTRERWQDALFGTYLWNADETVAELHDLRYRDGSPFSDRVIVYRTDERSPDATRNYAVPGRHRCVNCHMGAEAHNFVLGFTPLQLNRRAPGEGGLDADAVIEEDERSQVDRLIRLGVITGLRSAAELPRLEALTSREGKSARTPEELALQAYLVPNCSQCHNPRGFAVQSNPALQPLDFSAGGSLYAWDPFVKETNGLRFYAQEVENFATELKSPEPASALYQRVARPTNERLIHMPANVPGQDCRAASMVARWLATLDWKTRDQGLSAEQRAAAKQARLRQADAAVREDCVPPADVRWVGEDFTDKVPYEPRNTAWRSLMALPENAYLTGYRITPAHEALARAPFATNFWEPKDECAFDARAPAPQVVEPWMLDRLGNPRLPWGYLYFSTPGATVFQGVCANCHGRAANGQSGAAKTLVAFNGARVADLTHGLFGSTPEGAPNRALFESAYGADGAARYLVWMASGGTSVKFTEEFMQAWVKYGEVDIDFSPDLKDWARWGANMLGAARGACDLVRAGKFGSGSLEPHSGNVRAVGGARMWEAICTLDNPLTDAIRGGTNPDAVAEWLRHAQFNAGVMAYFYVRDFRDALVQERFYPLRTECEKR